MKSDDGCTPPPPPKRLSGALKHALYLKLNRIKTFSYHKLNDLDKTSLMENPLMILMKQYNERQRVLRRSRASELIIILCVADGCVSASL